MHQDTFFTLADRLCAGLTGPELLFCELTGEDSDFVRLNRNRIRQAGHVRALTLGLRLIAGARQVEGDTDLSGDPETDLARARALLAALRARIALVPEDPYLHYSTHPDRSERQVGAALPDAGAAVAALIERAGTLDLVGIWASGEQCAGLASALGHRHWHRSLSFNLDWSVHLEGDRALKDSYGGFAWDPGVLETRLAAMREGLAVMARPARTLTPGRYRAALAPAAVRELMTMLAWGGFDLKSHRTCQTPLLKLIRGERAFAPAVSIHEEHARGLAPGFTSEGFPKPAAGVALIEGGRFGDCLVTARAGREYGMPVNAAAESPEALALAAGALPQSELLARLGTGLWIGNLWYCNWSDPNDCRVTGLTRFGTWWVEDGAIVAPAAVMRFDDSLYRLLGDRLEGLTAERELLLSAETYDGRSTESWLLPGLLVSELALAL